MLWRNPVLNILLSLHYFASHVVSQLSYANFNGYQNNNNKFKNKGDFHKADMKCNPLSDNSSVLCHNNQNRQNYNYTYVPVIPINNQQYQYYGNFGGNNHNFHTPHPNQIQYQPVYYTNPYNSQDPLKSRVDQTGHLPTSHPSESHTNSNHQSHEHQEAMKGLGWSKGHHENDNHEKVKKKKKKTKKGALGKLLKKFKLKHKPEKLIWKEVSECDGWENFIKDLEIISWKLGWLGFKKATIGLTLHILNQVYLTFSVLIVGLPERFTSFVELIAPDTTPEFLRTALAIFGLVDYLINKGFSYPLGNLIVVIELIAEVLTIASLALATITIFDDIVEEKVWAIFGIDVRELFQGYGCNNPFSKEKKIEQFFEALNEW